MLPHVAGAPADAAALRGRDRPRRRQGRLRDAQARQGLGTQRRSSACRFASCARPANTWSPIRGQRSSASRRWASSRSTPGIRAPRRPTCTTASSSIWIRGRRSRGTDVVDAAGLVRQALADVRLRSWVKTTGGKGLHVVAPVEPTDVAACLAFARDLAAALVRHAPAQFTTANAKVGRERQILIDVLRNNRTNTSVAAYSLRARVGAPVSIADRVGRARPAASAGRVHAGHRARTRAPGKRSVVGLLGGQTTATFHEGAEVAMMREDRDGERGLRRPGRSRSSRRRPRGDGGGPICAARSRSSLGGSRGLGLALARELADAGCRLVIAARDEHDLADAARELAGRGAEVLARRCDVGNPRGDPNGRGRRARALRRHRHPGERGGLDPRRAGRGDDDGQLPRRARREFLGAAARHGRGRRRDARAGAARIVNITSIGGVIPVPHLFPYVCAKAAAIALSEGLGAELRKDGVTITTVIPGLMRTGSFPHAFFKGDARRELGWFRWLSTRRLTAMSAGPRRAADRRRGRRRRRSAGADGLGEGRAVSPRP